MSTKINVRSPFYLNLTEPVEPLPTFSCSVAFPNQPSSGNISVDNQGIVTLPDPDFGSIFSYTSSAGDFSNGKFAAVNTDTVRTVVLTLNIPLGFTNTSDLYFTCTQTATQPGNTSSVVQPTVCSGGPTTQGSIPAQNINSDGATVSIDLNGFFNNETTYDASNNNPLLITTALSGSTLTLTSNNLGGTATVYAIARDGSYPATCEAVQSITINITKIGATTWSCTSPANPAVQGGSIAANGTITEPQSAAPISGISLSSGGALITSVSANTGANSQNVTLFFKLTVPPGYTNAGSIVFCEKVLVQAGTTPKSYTCGIAALTGQVMSAGGAIELGNAEEGGIVKSFTPPNPPIDVVSTNTARTIEFQVEIPTGFNNAGNTINCSKEVIQPANITVCSSATNSFFITTGKSKISDFCNTTFATPNEIKSPATTIPQLLGQQICKNGNAFVGNNLIYGVTTASVGSGIGFGVGDFYAIQVDNNGICLEVLVGNCQAAGGDGITLAV